MLLILYLNVNCRVIVCYVYCSCYCVVLLSCKDPHAGEVIQAEMATAAESGPPGGALSVSEVFPFSETSKLTDALIQVTYIFFVFLFNNPA